MTPIVGFAPDSDLMTPGIFTDCTNVIPYEAGFKGAPTPVAAAVAALASDCRGAVVATQLDGTRRIFAGTQTKLYELVSGAWTDRSAGSYTGSTESRWSFCQFGNTTVATNLTDAMQSSCVWVLFSSTPGAPKAKIVVSASNNFVLAFNTVRWDLSALAGSVVVLRARRSNELDACCFYACEHGPADRY
jgi:hypothetical protein